MEIIVTNKLGIERERGDKNPVQWASQPGKDIWVVKWVFWQQRVKTWKMSIGYITTDLFKFILVQYPPITQRK